MHVFSEIEEEARAEILRNGGSLSHHHGVGKIRRNFLPEVVGNVGIGLLSSIKNYMDPNNIFASGNLIENK
jgi:alkyldihydroxyacetonephosphate synthase